MLDMLTPMLYIFVWPKRWGAIRDKGFAHVPIVEFKALDQVYRVCITYDFMKSPDPKIIVAADAKKPTETVAARAFSLAESNFWLRNLKIRDYEALFARTIEDTNHPHLFNHDTPLGTAPKSRKRSITSQKATIWPFFAIFPSENTFYLVPRGCGSIKGVPWNHLTISKT